MWPMFTKMIRMFTNMITTFTSITMFTNITIFININNVYEHDYNMIRREEKLIESDDAMTPISLEYRLVIIDHNV